MCDGAPDVLNVALDGLLLLAWRRVCRDRVTYGRNQQGCSDGSQLEPDWWATGRHHRPGALKSDAFYLGSALQRPKAKQGTAVPLNVFFGDTPAAVNSKLSCERYECRYTPIAADDLTGQCPVSSISFARSRSRRMCSKCISHDYVKGNQPLLVCSRAGPSILRSVSELTISVGAHSRTAMGCVHESTAAAAGPASARPSHRLVLRPSARHLGPQRERRSPAQTPPLTSVRDTAANSAATLTAMRCEPCESDSGSLGYMGLCGSLQQSEVQRLLREVRMRPSASRHAPTRFWCLIWEYHACAAYP